MNLQHVLVVIYLVVSLVCFSFTVLLLDYCLYHRRFFDNDSHHDGFLDD